MFVEADVDHDERQEIEGKWWLQVVSGVRVRGERRRRGDVASVPRHGLASDRARRRRSRGLRQGGLDERAAALYLLPSPRPRLRRSTRPPAAVGPHTHSQRASAQSSRGVPGSRPVGAAPRLCAPRCFKTRARTVHRSTFYDVHPISGSLHIVLFPYVFDTVMAQASTTSLPQKPKMKIAVLTSGGDSAGMNAATRSVVKMAIAKCGSLRRLTRAFDLDTRS